MTTTATTPEVGLELPPFSRVTGLENWNRYAAVNDEFVPIHMDDEAGRAAGMGGAFGMGNLQWAYLHNLLRSWLGGLDGPAGPDTAGRIVRLECQFRAPNQKGTTVTARGRVTAVRPGEPDGTLVDLEVWTEDETGAKLAPGTATVHLARG